MIRIVARYATRWWWAVIAFWLTATIVLVVVAPPFEEVATFDETAFLPADSDTVRGGELLEEAWPEDNFTRVASLALIRSDDEIREEDEEWALEVVEWLESDPPEGIGKIMTHLDQPDLEGALTSEDGHAMVVMIGFDIAAFTPQANRAVTAIRHHIHQENPPPDGLDVYVTGAAAVAADESSAIEASLTRAQFLSVFVVIAILLWVFRSPIAPLVPFTMIGVSYLVSLGVVSLLAQTGLRVSSLYETFSLVIIFGAGTDYGLLMVARYREELSLGESLGYARTGELRRRTVIATVAVLGAVIASSAGTVMVGFSAMSVAEFGLYRTMGPAMALAIAITLAAGLTLTPALMKMFGSKLLWPQTDPRHVRASDRLLIEERADELGFVGEPPRHEEVGAAEGAGR
jgi:putative drug exporter of the RND superfamily